MLDLRCLLCGRKVETSVHMVGATGYLSSLGRFGLCYLILMLLLFCVAGTLGHLWTAWHGYESMEDQEMSDCFFVAMWW